MYWENEYILYCHLDIRPYLEKLQKKISVYLMDTDKIGHLAVFLIIPLFNREAQIWSRIVTKCHVDMAHVQNSRSLFQEYRIVTEDLRDGLRGTLEPRERT